MQAPFPVHNSGRRHRRWGRYSLRVLLAVLFAVMLGCHSSRPTGFTKRSRATHSNATVERPAQESWTSPRPSGDVPMMDPSLGEHAYLSDPPADPTFVAGSPSAARPDPTQSGGTHDDASGFSPALGAVSPLDLARLNSNLPDNEGQDLNAVPQLPDLPPFDPDTLLPSALSISEAVSLLQSVKGSVQRDSEGQVTAVDASFCELSAVHFQAILRFDTLQQLDLTGSSVTDQQLTLVGQLPALRAVKLRGTAVTDLSLSVLSELSELQLLDVSKTAVTDRGLDHLTRSDSLKFLSLNSTTTSDESLTVLSRMGQLKGLSVIDTKLSADGIRQLRTALPDCVVVDGAGASRLPDAMRMQLALSSPIWAPSSARTDATHDPSAETRDFKTTSLSTSRPSDRDESSSRDQLLLMTQLAARRPELAISLADTYVITRQWDQVVEILQAAATTDPQNPELQFALARALTLSGRPRQAEQFLRTVAGDAAASYSMGLIAKEVMLNECENYFQQALISDPQLTDAQAQLAQIQQHRSGLHVPNPPSSVPSGHASSSTRLPFNEMPRIIPGAIDTQSRDPGLASRPSVSSAPVRSDTRSVPAPWFQSGSDQPPIELVPEPRMPASVRTGGGIAAGSTQRHGGLQDHGGL